MFPCSSVTTNVLFDPITPPDTLIVASVKKSEEPSTQNEAPPSKA